MSKYFDSQSRTFMEPNVIQNGNHMVMTNVYTDTKKNTSISILNFKKNTIRGNVFEKHT